MLIRCCDISTKVSSSLPGQPSLPNTFGEPPLMPIQSQVDKILYSRNNLIKRLLEDESGIEESSRTSLLLLGKQPTFLTLCSLKPCGR